MPILELKTLSWIVMVDRCQSQVIWGNKGYGVLKSQTSNFFCTSWKVANIMYFSLTMNFLAFEGVFVFSLYFYITHVHKLINILVDFFILHFGLCSFLIFTR